MAAYNLDTLVPRGFVLTGELNVEPRLGTSATASAQPTALVNPQHPASKRRANKPGRAPDVEDSASGTRRGAGRSLRLMAATRRTAARIPPMRWCGETWRPGTGR
jgi:hypothetical protein